MLLIITLLTTLAAGCVTLIFKRWQDIAKILSAVFFSISGVAAVATGLNVLSNHAQYSYAVTTGFPGFSCQFQLDTLSAFFFMLIGIVVFGLALFIPGYLRHYTPRRPLTSISISTAIFVFGMYLVVLAGDVISFMFAWELMSIASYFLVAYDHQNATNRKAAFIYLLMAHVSGLLILCGFGILAKLTGSYGFIDMHAQQLSCVWVHTAFILALVGFGMKAGLVPLHVWLPEAHPVAPSHISALMSGVMLKVAIYGFIRFAFYLLGNICWQWGVTVLLLGTLAAIFGVLSVLVQNDLKRLLAYCSVENVGIIFIGLGLSMIFISTGHMLLGALGLLAALYHCLNHALFKSLLFFGAGSVLQQSHEHDLEKMGGLIHKMPQTALFFLVGCISASALPPFNGFVSEWLILQTAFHATLLKAGTLRIVIPSAAAILALASALAAACFVKVFGVAFLGVARTKHVNHARDPHLGMRMAMGLLAFLCLFFGVFPSVILKVLNTIAFDLIGTGFPSTQNWFWLAPFSSQVSSYGAVAVLICLLILMVITYWLLRLFFKHTWLRKALPWDCGYGGLNSRMQYSSTAFAMPLRRVFKNVWPVQEKIEKTPLEISYQLTVGDWVWQYLYAPLERFMAKLSNVMAKIQGGNIRIYLAYVFFVLIFILWVVS